MIEFYIIFCSICDFFLYVSLLKFDDGIFSILSFVISGYIKCFGEGKIYIYI